MDSNKSSPPLIIKEKGIQVNIVFSNDQKMKELNKQFVKKDEVTDVLAFPVNESLEDGVYLLGEIVVNTEQAKRQAKEYGVSQEEEIVRLIAHGALHLLGYTDDREEGREEMEKVQEGIVDKLKIKS